MHRSVSMNALILTIAAAVAAASCSASAGLAVKADRSATLSLSIEIPEAVEAKVRQFAGSAGAVPGGSAPAQASLQLFDPKAIAASFSARGAAVRESVAPSSRSYRGSIAVPDLERFLAADRDLAGALEYARGPGWASLRLRASKGNAAALARLFPGLDEDLLEALQPPALYDNPVSAAEYRSMLASLLGKAAAAAIDGASLTLTASFPGDIIESGGLARPEPSRRSASLSVRALDAMVLEVPVEFYIKWKE